MELFLIDILVKIVSVYFVTGYIAAVLMFTAELLHGYNVWDGDFLFHTFVKFPLMGPVYLFRVFEALCNTWHEGRNVKDKLNKK